MTVPPPQGPDPRRSKPEPRMGGRRGEREGGNQQRARGLGPAGPWPLRDPIWGDGSVAVQAPLRWGGSVAVQAPNRGGQLGGRSGSDSGGRLR